MKLSSRSDLFGPVLGVGRQVVEGVVGLSDSAKQHRDHTCSTPGGTETHKRETINKH